MMLAVLRRVARRAVSELGRFHPPASIPFVTSFDAVPGAVVIPVNLPDERSSPPSTHVVSGTAPRELLEQSTLPPFRMCASVVPSGTLTGATGGVVSADGALVLESLWDWNNWNRSYNPPERLHAPSEVRGRYASLVTQWGHGFYHWMFEALPRLAVLRESGVSVDGVIVPDPISTFARETLNILGFGDDRIVPFRRRHLKVEELVWLSPLAPVSYPTPFSVRWLRQALGYVENPAASERIYIPRAVRGVANEGRVAGVLHDAGFTPVELSNMTISEQVKLWSNTRYVVGAHGAAFSNAIFSTRLTGMEFYQKKHMNVSFPAVFAACGHEHWTLLGRRVPGKSGTRHHSIYVPLGPLRAGLTAMGVG